MTGKGYCIENDNTNSGLKKNDSTYFNAFLFGLYVQPKFLLVVLIDTVLWSLLKFLQGAIKDNGANIVFTVKGFSTLSYYYYNGKGCDDTTRST